VRNEGGAVFGVKDQVVTANVTEHRFIQNKLASNRFGVWIDQKFCGVKSQATIWLPRPVYPKPIFLAMTDIRDESVENAFGESWKVHIPMATVGSK
jgi:hypothetical protein